MADGVGNFFEPCLRISFELRCVAHLYFSASGNILIIGLFFLKKLLSVQNAEECDARDDAMKHCSLYHKNLQRPLRPK